MANLLATTNNLPDESVKLPPIEAVATKKMLLWFKNYINSDNPKTFINQAQSAIYAKYKAKSYEGFGQIGYENYKKLEPYIKQWLDDYGLSENRLKLKLLSLTEAKETKFFQKDGKITDQVDVEALHIQQKSLDMAFKIKGLYQDTDRSGIRPVFNINFYPGDGEAAIDVTPEGTSE